MVIRTCLPMEDTEIKEEERMTEEGAPPPESGLVQGASSSEPAELLDELAKVKAEARENYDKFLRSAAELENFKRRASKERSELLKYAGEALAKDLLDVLDNLERAISASQSSTGEDFVSGVRMISEQFKSTMDRHGIRGESGIGGTFDPSKQEALASVPTADKEPGAILDEYRKAYFFKDKLLRPGQVIVASKLDEPKPQPESEIETEKDA